MQPVGRNCKIVRVSKGPSLCAVKLSAEKAGDVTQKEPQNGSNDIRGTMLLLVTLDLVLNMKILLIMRYETMSRFSFNKAKDSA